MTQEPLLDRLLETALPIDGVDDRRAVSEPATKALLADLGVDVPFGVTGDDPEQLATATADRTGRLVVKAFGSGLVHKTDVGAVQLDVEPARVKDVVDAMGERLTAAGIRPDGYLVEEQIEPAAELLVGIVRRDPFGHLVILGMGGTLTEVIDRTATRLTPLSRNDAHELVAELPDALLGGVRGAEPIDRDALADLLLTLAGEDGLVDTLGDGLAEMECNPVIAGPKRSVAVDARLILDTSTGSSVGTVRPESEPTDFGPVFAPGSVVVAGASTTRTTFGNWFLEGYRAAGWTDRLWALHPEADAIDGVPAVKSLDEIPGEVDYLLSAVPASRTADLLRTNGHRLRFAHIVSGGFGEIGDEGVDLEKDLAAAGRETDVRILGPNCMGAYSPIGRQTFSKDVRGEPGRVSVLSQSGSLAGELVRTGQARGLRYARLATLGNGIDVTPGELLDWLLDDPETGVIGLYLEGADDHRLVPALRRARGHKPVVVLAGGLSDQGSAAAASHTGAMTGDRAVWRAISRSLGVAVVDTLEHFMASLLYLQAHEHAGPSTASTSTSAPASTSSPDASAAVPDASRPVGQVALIGPGGGASVLATDAMDRAGLDVTPLDDVIVNELRAMGYGSGTSVANPIEIPVGPAAPADAHRRIVEPLLERVAFTDLVLHANVSSYYGFDGGVEVLVDTIRDIGAAPWGARVGLVLRSSDAATGVDLERIRVAAGEAGVVTFRDFDEAAAAVSAAVTTGFAGSGHLVKNSSQENS